MTKANKTLKANLLAIWASETEETAICGIYAVLCLSLIYPQPTGTAPQMFSSANEGAR